MRALAAVDDRDAAPPRAGGRGGRPRRRAAAPVGAALLLAARLLGAQAPVDGARVVALDEVDRVAASEGGPSVFRRVVAHDARGPAELVCWATAEGAPPALRLGLAGTLAERPARRGRADDPVALATLLVEEPGAVELALERAAPGTVRWQLHELPLSAARRAELLALQREVLAPRPPDREDARAAWSELWRRTLGPDGGIDSWTASNVARALGEQAGNQGFDELAAEAFAEALRFRAPLVPGESAAVLELRLLEARALARTPRRARALELLRACLPTLERLRGPGSPLAASVRQDLAQCLRLEGDLEGARAALLDAVASARPAVDDLRERRDARGAARLEPQAVEYVRLLHNAASACFELADFWRSLQLDRDALALLGECPPVDARFERAILAQLALTAKRMGIPSPAFAEELAGALPVVRARLGDEHEDVLRIESNLAQALSDAAEPARALPLAEHVRAARARRLGPDHPETLQACTRLAHVLSGLERLDEALALHRDVLARCADARAPGDATVLRCRRAIAWTLWRLGRRDEALAEGRRWIDGLAAELRGTLVAAPRERRERVAQLQGELSELDALGRRAGAGAAWDAALFGLIESARAAAAAGPLRVAAARDSEELAPLLARARDARAELGRLVAGAGSAARAELVAAAAARDAAERELARALRARALAPFEPLDAAALAAALPPGSAALGVVALASPDPFPRAGADSGGARWLRVHLLTRDGRVRVRRGATSAQVDAAVARWRAAIGEPCGDAPAGSAPPTGAAAERAAGQELVTLLFDDLLDALPPDVERLYVCSAGALELVPLDALHCDDGVLGDRLRVLPLTSFDTLLHAARPRPATPRLLAVGGLEYGEGEARALAPLPGSEREVERAAALFEAAGGAARVLRGAAATQDAVRAALGEATHLLLATHGWFDDAAVAPAPRDVAGVDEAALVSTLAPFSLCGLALSGANAGAPGGVWTGDELAGEDLSGLALVVLSACDSHAGVRRGGQGVLSLRAALHAAGAARSLTSLWRVKNDYGRELVERFLAAHLAGAGAADALWSAKRHLRDELGLETRFWAGWTLADDV